MDSTVSQNLQQYEWGQLLRLSRSDPGVVYLGYQTGQMALHLGTPRDDIQRAFLTAVSSPRVQESPLVFYHAVIHGTSRSDESIQQRRHFRHPFPALDWMNEKVPDFDLIDTVCVNFHDENSIAGPTTER